MKVILRFAIAKRKLSYYKEEIYALTHGALWEIIAFGLLVVVLFPLLIVEIVLLALTGKDMGLFQSSEPLIDNELKIEEVPDSLSGLVPLAMKWGIGDDGERGEKLESASTQELAELQKNVGPRVQEIADWLDTYTEEQLAKSATTGYFNYLICAYDEADAYKS